MYWFYGCNVNALWLREMISVEVILVLFQLSEKFSLNSCEKSGYCHRKEWLLSLGVLSRSKLMHVVCHSISIASDYSNVAFHYINLV